MPFLPQEQKAKLMTPVEKEPAPKDTSAFQGKPYLKKEDVKNWLKRDEMCNIIKKPKAERADLGLKIFQQKEVGEFIDPKEAGKIYKKIKDYPTESKKKYEIKSEGERYKILKTLEKFLGR